MDTIKAIIFDIGGVVVKFHDTGYFSYLSEVSGRSAKAIERMVVPMIPDFELGKLKAGQFERRIAEAIGIGRGEVQWLGFYKKHLEIDVDVTDLIRGLHDSYITGYITNIDAAKYSVFTRMFGKEIFDYGVASCSIHVRKPDPRIYRYMLKRMKVSPGEAVFIDDMPKNVRGARRLGINSILYKNRRQLDISLSKVLGY